MRNGAAKAGTKRVLEYGECLRSGNRYKCLVFFGGLQGVDEACTLPDQILVTCCTVVISARDSPWPICQLETGRDIDIDSNANNNKKDCASLCFHSVSIELSSTHPLPYRTCTPGTDYLSAGVVLLLTTEAETISVQST